MYFLYTCRLPPNGFAVNLTPPFPFLCPQVRTDDELLSMFTDGKIKLDFFKIYQRRNRGGRFSSSASTVSTASTGGSEGSSKVRLKKENRR